jgi:tetratricopeptide (TPR) repeat protein
VARFVPSLFAVALLSAAPPASPDALQREADAAAARGDFAAAERLYAAAGERAVDPGLVAFNRGTVQFAREEYREAELNFIRCLDDAAVPPDRRAKASYNRGVCLLKRGGSARIYRAAIDGFEKYLDAGLPDETLAADARHNLELAKVLWAQARAKDASADRPNDPPPEEKPEKVPPRPETGPSDLGPDATGSPTGPGSTPRAVPVTGPADGQPGGSDQKAPGAGTLPVLTDTDGVQKLSPEDTQTYLARIAARLDKDRRDTARLVAGPDRKTVRDW